MHGNGKPFELKDDDNLRVRLDEPSELWEQLEDDVEQAGGEPTLDPDDAGAVGRTMFDLPSSQDNSVTVLLPAEQINRAPSQSLVRIKSKDGRRYLGTVVAGPFHEPDGLRGDSSLLVTVVTRSRLFVPNYHGRVQVEIMGEELNDGTLVPPRYRPLPNSAASVLDSAEVARVLRADGDISIGQMVGQEEVTVGIPSTDKAVLPRHTAILGTTGGGKSTTVARLVQQAQQAGCAVVLLDVEGEYARLHEPTDQPGMLAALERRGLAPEGVANVGLYHLVGRDTANPDHPVRREFSLRFARLSPYAVVEILGMSEAQEERYFKAYEIAKALLRDLRVFPRDGDKRDSDELFLMDLDEFERGYPFLTLDFMIDVVRGCLAKAEKSQEGARGRLLGSGPGQEALQKRVNEARIQGSVPSWLALLGKLGRLARLRVFDREQQEVIPLNYPGLLRPGRVSVIDLSDTGASELTNLVIADLLRGVQEAQDEAYVKYERARADGREATPPARVLVIVEEAHEFLGGQRSEKLSVLYEQVARIAKRGRKRWLGLVFVTQLPQHLPRQLFGLVNSYVLHKIADPQVVSTLQRTIPGIDEGLWKRLPGLAPGQAIVAFPHLARPLLVAVDPAPARLRLVD